jgi:cyclophilin family peptidyl-prolyl cis-trans isomerase
VKRTGRAVRAAAVLLAAVLLAGGCGSGGSRTWNSPPPMKIDPKKTYEAVFDTSKGSFTVSLFADTAPITVNNFVFLAKEGFYNDVKFHRIIKPFMIQTGDPTGTGTGGPGYNIQDELKTPYRYEPGIVAMANTGQPNTGGSQFFICTGEQCSALNQMPNYSIFGKVSSGMDTVQAIASTPVKPNPATGELSVPQEDVKIKKITIKEK